MIIDCVSDLHGFYPELDGGDLLIIAGDLTATDTQEELDEFDNWLVHQSYKKKIFIAGNHDNLLLKEKPRKYMMGNNTKWIEKHEYLCDSGTEFEGLKIWGSPWSLKFKDLNPKCAAFTGRESDLSEKFNQIPEDVDILITHTPPYGILDKNKYGDNCGSIHLRNTVLDNSRLPKLCLHVFGHIHENGEKLYETTLGKFVNASIMNENYKPINKPVRIII